MLLEQRVGKKDAQCEAALKLLHMLIKVFSHSPPISLSHPLFIPFFTLSFPLIFMSFLILYFPLSYFIFSPSFSIHSPFLTRRISAGNKVAFAHISQSSLGSVTQRSAE